MLSLERTPRNSDIHVWSDYIELLCLISPDRLVSTSDIVDRLSEVADLDSTVLENNLEVFSTVDETSNELERKTVDWFRHLEFRSGVFDKYSVYPFVISRDRNTLYCKSELTTEHKFYIFLLLASNLRHVQKSIAFRITRTFEHISQLALKRCLPDFAEVHIFGTSGTSVGKYHGNLWNKINLLATDLKEQVRVNPDKLSVHNSGDGGLDLVGWVPMYDDASGLLTVLGQCACTEDWVSKQHSSSYAAWNGKLSFTSLPCNMIFIPFCFRDANGNWARPQDIHHSIVIDRIRFMYLLQNDYSFFAQESIYQEIDNIITFVENLV